MKNHYLITMLTLLCSIAAQAQVNDYQPLVREGVVWHYAYHHFINESVGSYATIQRLQFKGDTLINGVDYKKCYFYDSEVLNENEKPLCCAREENGKVMFTAYRHEITDTLCELFTYFGIFGEHYEDNGEVVVCDFGDMQGFVDQINDQGDVYAQIQSTSEVTVNGLPAKSYKIEASGCYPCSFIEGVGSDGMNTGYLFAPFTFLSTGFGSRPLGLVKLTDLEGNTLYKGACYDDFNTDEESDYQPLVREGVVWHWAYDNVEHKIDMDAYEYFNRRLSDFKIEFRGDTTLCGITYKKCYMYESDTLDITKKHPAAYGREENGKVMFNTYDNYPYPMESENGWALPGKYYDLTGELVVYDFADMENFVSQWEGDVSIQSVDYVTVGSDSVKRYQIDHLLANYCDGNYYVEGVGADISGTRALFDTGIYLPTGNVSLWDGLIMLTDRSGNVLYKGHNYDRFSYESIDYQPIVREDRTWVNLYRYTDLEANKEIEFTYNLFFKGDTIVNGLTYKKCYRVANDLDKSSQISAFFSDAEPIALLREFDGMVFAHYLKEQPEFDRVYNSPNGAHTLYDFSYCLYKNSWDMIEVDGQPCVRVQDRDFGNVVSSIGVDNGMTGDLLYPIRTVLPGMQYDETHFLYTINADNEIIYFSSYFDTYVNEHRYDLNHDGQIDIADVNIMINVLLGYDVPTGNQGHDTAPAIAPDEYYDVTGDGHVDISDVNAIINKILGK